MQNVKSKIKKELIDLYKQGREVIKTMAEEAEKSSGGLAANMSYQSWYSKTLPVIRQTLPERYQEFQEQYKVDKRKELDVMSYTISDFFNGMSVVKTDWAGRKEETFSSFSLFLTRFQNQLFILKSAFDRIDMLLADIEGVLQAQLFGTELQAAEDLHKKGHLRAAGALAGVTLEFHLSTVCRSHEIKFRKKSPTISDYNEALKKEAVVDVPTWRLIQRLGDIRNICVHFKDREPSKSEVSDLIEGVHKITANVS